MNSVVDVEVESSLLERAQRATDLALRALVGAEPLVPFAATWRGDELTVERFMVGSNDDCIEQAMRTVADADEAVTAYAVVWSGYVEVEGEKWDAVVLEAGERGSESSVQLAQPYRIGAAGEPEKGPDLFALGMAPSLLTFKFTYSNMPSHLIRPAYVTTQGHVAEITSQPYAQMLLALICLGANLTEEQAPERITVGIRKMQSLEAGAEVALCRRVLSALLAVVGSGDLGRVLGSDDVSSLTNLVVGGANQLQSSVQKGLVPKSDAAVYVDTIQAVFDAVLTNDGKEPPPEKAQRLTRLFEHAVSGVRVA